MNMQLRGRRAHVYFFFGASAWGEGAVGEGLAGCAAGAAGAAGPAALAAAAASCSCCGVITGCARITISTRRFSVGLLPFRWTPWERYRRSPSPPADRAGSRRCFSSRSSMAIAAGGGKFLIVVKTAVWMGCESVWPSSRMGFGTSRKRRGDFLDRWEGLGIDACRRRRGKMRPAAS